MKKDGRSASVKVRNPVIMSPSTSTTSSFHITYEISLAELSQMINARIQENRLHKINLNRNSFRVFVDTHEPIQFLPGPDDHTLEVIMSIKTGPIGVFIGNTSPIHADLCFNISINKEHPSEVRISRTSGTITNNPTFKLFSVLTVATIRKCADKQLDDRLVQVRKKVQKLLDDSLEIGNILNHINGKLPRGIDIHIRNPMISMFVPSNGNGNAEFKINFTNGFSCEISTVYLNNNLPRNEVAFAGISLGKISNVWVGDGIVGIEFSNTGTKYYRNSYSNNDSRLDISNSQNHRGVIIKCVPKYSVRKNRFKLSRFKFEGGSPNDRVKLYFLNKISFVCGSIVELLLNRTFKKAKKSVRKMLEEQIPKGKLRLDINALKFKQVLFEHNAITLIG